MLVRYTDFICHGGAEYFQYKHEGVYFGSIKDKVTEEIYSVGVTRESLKEQCPYFEVYNHNTRGRSFIPLHDAYYLGKSYMLSSSFVKYLNKWLKKKSKLYHRGMCNNYRAIVAYIAKEKSNTCILDVKKPNYRKLMDY